MLDEQRIAQIVSQVLKELQKSPGGSYWSQETAGEPGPVFASPDEALKAADRAQKDLLALPLEKRGQLIQALRETALANAEKLAKMAYEETRLGRPDHKTIKNQCAARMTPGMEILVSESKTGDYGQFLVERKPFGVIFSLMPVTHPVATMVNHAIAMIAAGNAVVFSAHPRALQCSLETVRILNKALVEAGGPPNLVGIVGKSDVALSQEMMKHPLVNLVVATGGPALAKAALTSGKKAIVGGPGNPPVIVDETADLAKAARDIMAGAVFDNNLLCVGEKAIIAVGGIKKDLARAFADRGTYLLSDEEARRVTGLVIKDGKLNPAYVGQDARVILNDAGIRAPEGTEMALLEAEVGHPLVVYEQMMPVIPLLSVSDFEQAVELARKIENNFGHTAVIHSQNLKRIHYFIIRMNTTMVVVNAPSYSPLGIEGEGVFGHTIAGPTGEGIATAKTFTRVKYTVSGLVG